MCFVNCFLENEVVSGSLTKYIRVQWTQCRPLVNHTRLRISVDGVEVVWGGRVAGAGYGCVELGMGWYVCVWAGSGGELCLLVLTTVDNGIVEWW